MPDGRRSWPDNHFTLKRALAEIPICPAHLGEAGGSGGETVERNFRSAGANLFKIVRIYFDTKISCFFEALERATSENRGIKEKINVAFCCSLPYYKHRKNPKICFK